MQRDAFRREEASHHGIPPPEVRSRNHGVAVHGTNSVLFHPLNRRTSLYVKHNKVGLSFHEMAVYREAAEEKETDSELIRKLFWLALGAVGLILLLRGSWIS
ncbi:MAG: hypothetical protein ACE5H0_03240 [Bacteroidota bacterium]